MGLGAVRGILEGNLPAALSPALATSRQGRLQAERSQPAFCLLYSTHHKPSLSVPDNLGYYSEERRKRPPQLLFPITASQHGITRGLHKLKHALPAARGRTASNAVRKVERSSESVHLGSRWGAGERGQQRDPRAGRGGGLEPLQPALPLLREGSEVSLSAPASPRASQHRAGIIGGLRCSGKQTPGGLVTLRQKTPLEASHEKRKTQLVASSREFPSTLRKMQSSPWSNFSGRNTCVSPLPVPQVHQETEKTLR